MTDDERRTVLDTLRERDLVYIEDYLFSDHALTDLVLRTEILQLLEEKRDAR